MNAGNIVGLAVAIALAVLLIWFAVTMLHGRD